MSHLSTPPSCTSSPIMVAASADGVKCNGGNGVLGHPEVYYTLKGQSEVVCMYCGQHFVKSPQ